MTAEERIAQLEAEVRSLRLVNEGLAVAVRAANRRLEQEGDALAILAARREAARVKKQQQRAMRSLSRDPVPVVSPGQTRDIVGTPPPPPSSSSLPSSFPPSSEPPSSYPLSFPPSSPTSTPISLPPASRPAPEQRDLLPEEQPPAPATKAREAKKREPTGDPRHAPLVKALTDAGWPFDGAKDAAHVKTMLALADQQEATRGDLAGVEILRRARIAWNQFPGFYSARTISGLRSKWGEFASPDTGKATGPPNLTRGSVRAELMDHTKPQEPF